MSKTLRDEFLSDLATQMVAERLFARVPDIVFCVKNDARRYISVNPAFAERLGLRSPDQILGRTAEDLFPPHLAAVYRCQDDLVLGTGQEITDRMELIFNRDGSLGWYLASKVPLFGKQGDIIGLASISRDLQKPGDADLRLAGLAHVVDVIHRDYAENLKPAELANIAGFSPSQLERRMRKVFKLTTVQFIRKTRLDNAARQLINPDKPIIDIALECGYGDQSAFSRQFKATVGMTPGAYRDAYA